MKGTIIVNPYDPYPVQKRKAARMAEEFAELGVKTEILPNDGFLAYICGGKVHCKLDADFVLYFDKDRIAAKLLEKQGIRLFNSASATEICDDKMLTHTLLANNGIPMPDTVAGPLCYNPSAAVEESYLDKAAETLGFPMVVKECHGSFGEQVYLCGSREALRSKLNEIKTKPYLLQRFEGGGSDMRVIVIGGKALCAVKRTNVRDFRSNAAQGGVCEKTEIPDDVAAMCEKAARIIGLDYCGVDVLPSHKLIEVNSNAMFEAMENATGVNVAAAYARHIVQVVSNK